MNMKLVEVEIFNQEVLKKIQEQGVLGILIPLVPLPICDEDKVLLTNFLSREFSKLQGLFNRYYNSGLLKILKKEERAVRLKPDIKIKGFLISALTDSIRYDFEFLLQRLYATFGGFPTFYIVISELKINETDLDIILTVLRGFEKTINVCFLVGDIALQEKIKPLLSL